MLLLIQLSTHSHAVSPIFPPLPIPACVKTSDSKAQIKTLHSNVDSSLSFHIKLDIHRPLYTSIFLCKVYICHNLLWKGDRSRAHLEVGKTMLPSRIYNFLITKVISVLFLRKILSEVFQDSTEIKLI